MEIVEYMEYVEYSMMRMWFGLSGVLVMPKATHFLDFQSHC